jgi:hypothetical protein
MGRRLLLFVSSKGGGAERVAACLTNAWVQRGCRYSNRRTRGAQLLFPYLRKSTGLPIRHCRPHRRTLGAWHRFRALRRLLRAHQPSCS